MSSRKAAKADAFLSKMDFAQEAPEAPRASQASRPAAIATIPAKARRLGSSRQGLKHIGGYLDDEAVERFALLKVRTKLGNDELLTRAINALWREIAAEKAFNA